MRLEANPRYYSSPAPGCPHGWSLSRKIPRFIVSPERERLQSSGHRLLRLGGLRLLRALLLPFFFLLKNFLQVLQFTAEFRRGPLRLV